MLTKHRQVSLLVEDIFSDFSYSDRLRIKAEIYDILEGKDIGKFRGDISVFKQRAIDTAAALPRPVISRRGIEKLTGKQLDLLVTELQREMLSHLSRYRAEEPSRRITEAQFRKKMKQSLSNAYRKAYFLGTEASGLGQANDKLFKHSSGSEKNWLNSVISQEQKYFNKFLRDLIRGVSQKQAVIRIGNYANAVRSVYESARILQIPDNSILHWVLQSGNPCPDCRLLHRLSPFTKATLPTTPKAGSTRCLSYCYCKIRVVKAKPGEVERVTRKNKSAEAVLRKLRQNRKRK